VGYARTSAAAARSLNRELDPLKDDTLDKEINSMF
jgi:hypothetical protein